MTASPPPSQHDLSTTIPLRILATSDLHMHVLGYDYFLNRPSDSIGLSRIASLISAERQQCDNTLLFDNGDLLQGSPMGISWPSRACWPSEPPTPRSRR